MAFAPLNLSEIFSTKPKANHSAQYIQYHNSAHWQVVRAHCMIRAKGMCERCKKQVAREVHIKKYESNLFKTKSESCEALCKPCHNIRDEERRKRNQPQWR